MYLLVLDPLFQVSPTLPLKCDKTMTTMWKNYTNVNIAYAEAVAARYHAGDIGMFQLKYAFLVVVN